MLNEKLKFSRFADLQVCMQNKQKILTMVFAYMRTSHVDSQIPTIAVAVAAAATVVADVTTIAIAANIMVFVVAL